MFNCTNAIHWLQKEINGPFSTDNYGNFKNVILKKVILTISAQIRQDATMTMNVLQYYDQTVIRI